MGDTVKTQDGTITLEPDRLVIRYGRLAPAAKRSGSWERSVPLTAVEHVEVQPTQGMRAGVLEVVLAGGRRDAGLALSFHVRQQPDVEAFAQELRARAAGAAAVPEQPLVEGVVLEEWQPAEPTPAAVRRDTPAVEVDPKMRALQRNLRWQGRLAGVELFVLTMQLLVALVAGLLFLGVAGYVIFRILS